MQNPNFREATTIITPTPKTPHTRTSTKKSEGNIVNMLLEMESLGDHEARFEKLTLPLPYAQAVQDKEGKEDEMYNWLKDEFITIIVGKFISFISFLMIILSSISYAVFWTLVSKLLTDPNYNTIQVSYDNDHPPTERENLIIFFVSFFSNTNEFFRNYLTVIAIPAGISFFSNFVVGVRNKEVKLRFSRVLVGFCVVSVFCSFVLALVSALFLIGDPFTYMFGKGARDPLPKLSVASGALGICVLQVILWLICYICFRFFEDVEDGWKAQFIKILFCGANPVQQFRESVLGFASDN